MKNQLLSPTENLLGLQPGEAYGLDEKCFTDETTHSWRGKSFDVFYDQNAGALSQWKSFSLGIGTISEMEREKVIARMRAKIEAFQDIKK